MRAAALSVLHERLAVLKAQEERRRQTLLASLAVAAHDSPVRKRNHYSPR